MLITSCARNLVLHSKYIAGRSRAILEAASEFCWRQGYTRCRQTFQPVLSAGRHRRWKTSVPRSIREASHDTHYSFTSLLCTFPSPVHPTAHSWLPRSSLAVCSLPISPLPPPLPCKKANRAIAPRARADSRSIKPASISDPSPEVNEAHSPAPVPRRTAREDLRTETRGRNALTCGPSAFEQSWVCGHRCPGTR